MRKPFKVEYPSTIGDMPVRLAPGSDWKEFMALTYDYIEVGQPLVHEEGRRTPRCDKCEDGGIALQLGKTWIPLLSTHFRMLARPCNCGAGNEISKMKDALNDAKVSAMKFLLGG